MLPYLTHTWHRSEKYFLMCLQCYNFPAKFLFVLLHLHALICDSVTTSFILHIHLHSSSQVHSAVTVYITFNLKQVFCVKKGHSMCTTNYISHNVNHRADKVSFPQRNGKIQEIHAFFAGKQMASNQYQTWQITWSLLAQTAKSPHMTEVWDQNSLLWF